MKKILLLFVLIILNIQVLYAVANHTSEILDFKEAKNYEDSAMIIQGNFYTVYNFNNRVKMANYLVNLGIKYKKPKIEARGYNYLSETYFEKFDLKNAILYNEKMLIIYKKIDYKRNLTRAYAQKGKIYYIQNENDSAEKYFNIAIDFLKKLPDSDKLDLNGVYVNLGLVYSQRKNYDKAFEYYQIARDESYKYNDVAGVSNSLYQIGYTYMSIQEFKLAEKYFLESMDYYNKNYKIFDAINVVGVEHGLATLYAYMYQHEKSISYARKALIYHNETGNKDGIVDLNELLSNDFLMIKKYDSAEYYGLKSYNYAKEFKNNRYIALSTINLMNVYKETKKYKLSEEYLNQFISNPELKSSLTYANLYEFYQTCANLYEEQSNYKKSLYYYKLYSQYADSNYKFQLNAKTHEIETKYQTGKKEAEILTLQNKNLASEVALNKESRIKWILGVILAMSLIGIGIFWKLYQQIKTQKEYIENLQKELHHRIKNNLSIINKFIEDIKSKADKDNIELDLTDLQNKIESINTVHKQLYDTQGIQDLRLKEYIDSVAENVSKTFNQKIEIQNHVDDKFSISLEQVYPLGLIINEFMTNSFKHGFEKMENPIIKIQSLVVNNKLKQIEISDNGVGYKSTENTQKTLGVKMMNLLSRQMNSKLELYDDNGTTLKLIFD